MRRVGTSPPGGAGSKIRGTPGLGYASDEHLEQQRAFHPALSTRRQLMDPPGAYPATERTHEAVWQVAADSYPPPA